MAKKKKTEENYLEKCPVHAPHIAWDADDAGIVTLHIENKGIMNRIFQLILKKPKVSHIHLDELGSFIWQQIDGERTLLDMGAPMEEAFGERAQPTYERIAEFIRTLEMYRFITFN